MTKAVKNLSLIIALILGASTAYAQPVVDPSKYAEVETPAGTQVIITTDADVDPVMAARDVERFKNNLPQMSPNMTDDEFLRQARKSCLRNGRPSTLKTLFSKKILSKAGLAVAGTALAGTGREMVSEFGEEYIGDFLGMTMSMAMFSSDNDDPAYLTHWAEESILNPQSHFIIGGVVISMQAGMGLARHSGLIDELCNFYLSPKAVIPDANGRSVARRRVSQRIRTGDLKRGDKVFEVLKRKVDWIRAKRTFVSGTSMGVGIGLFTAIWDRITDKDLKQCRKGLVKVLNESFENNYKDFDEFERVRTACVTAYDRWTSTQKYADYVNGTASGAALGYAIYALRESVGHILRNEVLDRWERKLAADLGKDSTIKLLNKGGTLFIKSVRAVRHASKMGGPKGFMIEVMFEATTFLFYTPFTEKIWNPVVRPWMRQGAYLKDANNIIDDITDLTDLGFFEGQINRPITVFENSCANSYSNYSGCVNVRTEKKQKPLEHSYKKMLSRSAEWHAFLSEEKDQTQQKWDELLRSFQPLWDGAYSYYETMVKYGDHDILMPNTENLDDLLSPELKSIFYDKYINQVQPDSLSYLSDNIKAHGDSEKKYVSVLGQASLRKNQISGLLVKNYLDGVAWNYANYIETLIKKEYEYENLIDKLKMIGQEQLEQTANECQAIKVASKQNLIDALKESRPDIYSSAMEALNLACESYYSDATKKMVESHILNVVDSLQLSNTSEKLAVLREDYEAGSKSKNFDALRKDIFTSLFAAFSKITKLMVNDNFEHYVGDQYVAEKAVLFSFSEIMEGTGLNVFKCAPASTYALPLNARSHFQLSGGVYCDTSEHNSLQHDHRAQFRNLVRDELKMYPHEDLRINPMYNALAYLGKPFQLNMSIEDLDAELALSSEGKLFTFDGHMSETAPGFNHSRLKKVTKSMSSSYRDLVRHKLHAFDAAYRPIDHISYQFLCGDQNPHSLSDDFMFDKDWAVPFFKGNSKRPSFNPPAMGSLLPETHRSAYSLNLDYKESICSNGVDTFQYMDYSSQDPYEVYTQIKEPHDYQKKRQAHFHGILNKAYAQVYENDCDKGVMAWARKDITGYVKNLKETFFADVFSCDKPKLEMAETNKMMESAPEEVVGSAIRYAVKSDSGKWYADRHEMAYHRVEPAFLLNKDKFAEFWQDKVYNPGMKFLVDFSQRYKKQMYSDLSKTIWTKNRDLHDLGLKSKPFNEYKKGKSHAVFVNIGSRNSVTLEEKGLVQELFNYRGRTLSHEKLAITYTRKSDPNNIYRNHSRTIRTRNQSQEEIDLNKYQKFSAFSRDEVENIFSLSSNSKGEIDLTDGHAVVKEKLSDVTAALYIKHVLEKPVRSFDKGLGKDFEYGLHAGDLSVYRLFARQIWGLYKEANDNLDVFTDGFSAQTLNIAYQLLRLDYFITLSYEFLDKSRCAIDESRSVSDVCRSQTQLVVSEAYKKIISTIALPERREFYSAIVGLGNGGGDPMQTGQQKAEFLTKINNTFNLQGYQYNKGSALIDMAFKSLDAEGKDFLLDNSKLTSRYDESDYSTAFDFDTYFYKLGTRGMKLAIQLYVHKLLNDLGVAPSVDKLVGEGESAEFVVRVEKGEYKNTSELIYQSVMSEAVKSIKKTFDNILAKASWNITLNEKEFYTDQLEHERKTQKRIDHIVDQTLITIAPLTNSFDIYLDTFTGLTCDNRLVLDELYMFRTDIIKSVRCANIDFSESTAMRDFKGFRGAYKPGYKPKSLVQYSETAKKIFQWVFGSGKVEAQASE